MSLMGTNARSAKRPISIHSVGKRPFKKATHGIAQLVKHVEIGVNGTVKPVTIAATAHLYLAKAVVRSLHMPE